MPSAEIAGPKIESSYVVTIVETPAENVGIGGVLIADNRKK